MKTAKSKVLSEAEFRAKVMVKTDAYNQWHVRVDTASNAYSRQYHKGHHSRTAAKDRFVSVWYPVYLDDMGVSE